MLISSSNEVIETILTHCDITARDLLLPYGAVVIVLSTVLRIKCKLDGAKIDKDGYFWLLGRVDDVMNVSGHRVSTMEVESALVDHKSVAEAAVIGKNHDIKGQAIAAFVTVKGGIDGTAALMDELKSHVAKKIGALARPDDIIFSAELPKTRSGKIMRRLLRDIAEGRALGDTTTLADPAVVASLKTKYEDQEG